MSTETFTLVEGGNTITFTCEDGTTYSVVEAAPVAGVDGLSVLNGAGAPGAGTGVDGDFYIDTTAHSIYGPKASGAWGSSTSLVGPAGADGAAGATGATGPALPSTINAQTGTTYTLVLGDAADLITLSNSSAITLTVPPNSSVAFPVCSQVSLAQIGAGQVTVAGDTGVTVNATPGLKLRAQYSAATLIKTGTDSWLLVGDLSS